jgi:transposase-like protein
MDNETLTQEQIDQYVAGDGLSCPHCGSQDLEGGRFASDGGGAFQRVDCHGCKASWVDCYSLTGITELQ